MANELMYSAGHSASNYYWQISGLGDNNGVFVLGNYIGFGAADGAIRFPSVSGSGAAAEAQLFLYITSGTGSGNIKVNIRGIKELNTGSFSYPFGRSITTALVSWEFSRPGTGQWININITDLFNEVRQQGGWSSGNAMGFLLFDNGSPNDVYSQGGPDDLAGGYVDSFLVVRESAEPNFTPTPKLVTAPTFPPAGDWGMAQAYPGKNVFTATKEEQYYNSGKRVNKIIAEGVVNTTAGVLSQIAHGLSYTPFATAYAKSNTSAQRFKLPRYMPITVQQGPEGDTLEGDVEVNATHLRIITTEDAEVYYRIFMDELD